MKHLKPSHREKKRYLIIEGSDANKEAIDKAILEYIGILGYAKASPKIISKDKGNLILAVNRAELDKIRAAFLLSEKNIQVKKVSGTLKSIRSKKRCATSARF